MLSGQPPDTLSQELLELSTHSFIVKIWLEEADEADRVKWRGHITHVPDGKRRYLNSLSDITAFIQSYLETMGVRFGLRMRLRRWLSRRKH